MAGSTARGLGRHVVGKIQSPGGQVTHTHTHSRVRMSTVHRPRSIIAKSFCIYGGNASIRRQYETYALRWLTQYFGTLLDRLMNVSKMKELMKNTLFPRSYSIMNADIADFASCCYNVPCFFPTHIDCIVYSLHSDLIYMQKSMAMDQYEWSYGSVKFDAEMMSFEANTRQAVALSILVFCWHIMHTEIEKSSNHEFELAGQHIDPV